MRGIICPLVWIGLTELPNGGGGGGGLAPPDPPLATPLHVHCNGRIFIKILRQIKIEKIKYEKSGKWQNTFASKSFYLKFVGTPKASAKQVMYIVILALYSHWNRRSSKTTTTTTWTITCTPARARRWRWQSSYEVSVMLRMIQPCFPREIPTMEFKS